MLESVSEVHYTPTGFPLPVPTLTNPSPAEQSQGREKTSTGPEIRRSAKRGMLKRSLPCSARRCSRGRERGMCLLAAGEPGNAARRLLPGGGKGWTERCERLRGGHGSAQVQGWAGVSSGRDAASALIAGRCVAKKKKKASPAHSTDPAWGGMLLPGSLHHPLGGKTPTRDGTLPAELFPASPQQHRAVMGTLGRRRLGKALLPAAALPDKENEAQNLCRRMHLQVPVLSK